MPQILINRERLSYLNFDVELCGNCDDIIGDLCRRLGQTWDHLVSAGPLLKEISMSDLPAPASPPVSNCFSQEKPDENAVCREMLSIIEQHEKLESIDEETKLSVSSNISLGECSNTNEENHNSNSESRKRSYDVSFSSSSSSQEVHVDSKDTDSSNNESLNNNQENISKVLPVVSSSEQKSDDINSTTPSSPTPGDDISESVVKKIKISLQDTQCENSGEGTSAMPDDADEIEIDPINEILNMKMFQCKPKVSLATQLAGMFFIN